MAWTAFTFGQPARRNGLAVIPVIFARDDSTTTATREFVETTLDGLKQHIAGVMTELQSNDAVVAGVTVGATIDLTITPPVVPPDDLAVTAFADRWRRFSNGTRAIELGVLLPLDANVATLKQQLTDTYAAASVALQRRFLSVMATHGF